MAFVLPFILFSTWQLDRLHDSNGNTWDSTGCKHSLWLRTEQTVLYVRVEGKKKPLVYPKTVQNRQTDPPRQHTRKDAYLESYVFILLLWDQIQDGAAVFTGSNQGLKPCSARWQWWH